MKYPIIDFHCDLLAYLEEVKSATPFDPISRCSIPQLEAGGVETQICAVFAETKQGAAVSGERQVTAFCQLPPSNVHFRLAIENASALLDEDEPFSLLYERLDAMPTPVYISLTWNGENRFGGGNETTVGLKKDGKSLLDFLSGTNIALDLSHTSDALAFEALQYIDKNCLPIPILASHSNARHITDVKRNLPDELLSEIIKRKGLIGLNGITHFLGSSKEALLKHIDHILSLGGEHSIACGADFFGGITLTTMRHLEPFFFDEFSDASCYPNQCEIIEKAFGQKITEKMANKNAKAYFERNMV